MQCCDFPPRCQQKQHFEFWLIIQLEEFQSSLQISRRTTLIWIVTETKQSNRRRKCKMSVRKHCASHWQSAKSLNYTSLPLTSAATTPHLRSLFLGDAWKWSFLWTHLTLQIIKAFCCSFLVLPHYKFSMPHMYFETCLRYLFFYVCIFCLHHPHPWSSLTPALISLLHDMDHVPTAPWPKVFRCNSFWEIFL